MNSNFFKNLSENLVQSSLDGILAFDRECRYILWNPAMERITGLEKSKVLGKCAFDVFPFLKKTGEDHYFSQALEGKNIIAEERPYIVPETGREGFFEGHYSPLRGESGEIVGGVAIIREITERKRAEEVLREANQTLQALIEASPLAIIALDLDGKVKMWNPAAEQIFGWSEEEVIGHFNPVIPKEKEDEFKKLLRDVLQGKALSGIEVSRQKKDGSQIDLSLSSASLRDAKGHIRGVMGILADMTDRKQAEAALRTKTDQLTAVTEAMAAYLKSGDWREASARLLRSALAQTKSEYGFIGVMVEGPALRILAHEGIVWDPVANRDFYENALRTYDHVGYLEFTNLNNLFGYVVTSGKPLLANRPSADPRSGGLPPGHPPLRHFLGVPIFLETEVVGIIGVANRPGGYTGNEQAEIEILSQAAGVLYDSYRRKNREAALENQRKLAVEALRKSEGRFRRMVESNIIGIIFSDVDGKITEANDAFLRMVGYSRKELYAGEVNWKKMTPPEYSHLDRKAIQETVKTGSCTPFEKEYIRKDGSKVPVLIGVALLEGSQKEGVSFVLDMTERKQAEEQLEKSREQLRHFSTYLQSRLEEERTHIAREIHDEFGQTLTVLKMELSWLKKQFSGNRHALREKIQSMSKLIDNAIQMVRKIATDLRPGVLDDLGLTAAIEWQAQEFEKRTGIPCRLNIVPEDLTVDPDRSTALFRILQEALTNVARHAKADQVDIRLIKETSSLVLQVKDNGIGITEGQANHSKSLGLLGIRERVRLWEGKVTIRGVKGEGTEVYVQLPAERGTSPAGLL